MAFTAQDVKALREQTGCGMMDCKKALQEADGDMSKALDFLREQGLAKQAKKASRIAAEGVAFAKTSADNKVGVVVEINAETDFVAKNADFMAFVETVANTILEGNPADVDALMTLTAVGNAFVNLLLECCYGCFTGCYFVRDSICICINRALQGCISVTPGGDFIINIVLQGGIGCRSRVCFCLQIGFNSRQDL